MKVFRMNGTPILGPTRFMERFSPEDFLRSRELAAGFACQHMAGLFCARNRYCSALLAQTVFHQKRFERSLPHSPDDFFRMECALEWMSDDVERAQLEASASDCAQLLQGLWELAGQTGLSEAESAELFLLLGTGFLLAGKTLEEISLDPDRVRDAFLRQSVRDRNRERWLRIGPEGDILLQADTVPYRILLNQERARALQEAGKNICFKRLVAGAHRQGNRSVPVILELYQDSMDSEPQRVEIRQGDYRYLNCVEDVPFHLHPVAVTSGETWMGRQGQRLCLRCGEREHSIPAERQDIVCFAPEANGQGFVLITATGADYSRYSLRKYFSPFVCQGMVDVRMHRGICYTLRRDGSVFSDRSCGNRINSGVLTLEEMEL